MKKLINRTIPVCGSRAYSVNNRTLKYCRFIFYQQCQFITLNIPDNLGHSRKNYML
jgi:hypothetical protein